MNDNKVKIRNRLFFKLFLTFAFLVILFAVILGYIFMRLYNSAAMENHLEEMRSQAGRISRQMTEYIINDDYESCLRYLQMVPEGGNWRDLPEDVVEQAMGGAYTSGGGKVGFFRRLSYAGMACEKTIVGQGFQGYVQAIGYLKERLG